MERFSVAIEKMNLKINKPYRIEYSAGIATFSYQTDKSLEEMIKQADTAMYEQKKSNAI
jgi:GGDEF domain-containing protein